MLLTPLFLWWILKQGRKQVIIKFILFWLPYTLFHVLNGANLFYSIKSSAILFTVYIFSYTFYVFLKTKKIETYFPQILKINFGLLVLALTLFFTPWLKILWTTRNLTLEIKNFTRLEMLTYEPSYYSLLLVPIVIYYSLKILLLPSEKKLITYFLSIYLPLILSFSLGVMSTLVFSFFLLFILNIKTFLRKKLIFYKIISVVIISIGVLVALFFLYPDNPLFLRIQNISAGTDISAKGRTVNAFQLAYDIALKKSLLFGVGLGQIKIIGAEIIRDFYNYEVTDLSLIRIPNAIGETLAMYGVSGLVLRLGIQFYLFFKTKTYSNYFRTTIFIFAFIYQFTGSFFTNIVEMVLWIIAFTTCCSIFDRKQFFNEDAKTINSVSEK